MSEWLQPGERLDELKPGRFRILQKAEGFRFGMDTVLLADFARIRPRDRVGDFGTGTGILPLLLLDRDKGCAFEAFELQESMADMAARTMALNGLTDQVRVHCLPVEHSAEVLAPNSLDVIVCNPPYGVPGTTLTNPAEDRRISRHQGEEGLLPWYRAAYRALKGKGRLAMVYPAPRLWEAMRDLAACGLMPKRLRCVYPGISKPMNLVLL